MKASEDLSIKEFQQWFQNSLHKEHYDTFIHTDEGLYKLLNTVFKSHSFTLPLPKDYVRSNKDTLHGIISPNPDSEYFLVVEFQAERPILNRSPIRRNKVMWDGKSPEGENIIESLSGYLHIKVPVTIVLSVQRDNGNNRRELRRGKHVLTFRRFPLLDNKSIFWWGKPGHEIQRIPLGLIRYAPGPLLEELGSMNEEIDSTKIEKKEWSSRLFIRGEFGDALLLKIKNTPFALNRVKELSDILGSLTYENRNISIQDIFNALDKNLRVIIAKVLKIKYPKGSQNAANKHFFKLLNENRPFLYLSELGRRRLENKLKALLGDDYQLFNEFKIQDNSFVSMRDIAMAIAGLAKNYSQIHNLSDDKLHLGNRVVLLLHHIASRSIYTGIKLAFSNPVSPNFKLPLNQLLDSIFNRTSELLELSTMLTDKRLHNYIIHSTQIVDDTNPLSLLSQRRKITFCGPGGIEISHTSNDISIRDIHPSHYGRICIVETNEGKGVGLNLQLASMSRVRYNGEIETPYRMPGDQIKWWSAAEEIILDNETGRSLQIRFLDKQNKGKNLLAHCHTLELNTIPESSKDDLPQDVSFIQSYGPAALFVPFIQHCDGTRAMMGAKNMKQALIPDKPEEPIVQTGFEKTIAQFDNPDLIERNSALSLGVNALVAYMPWMGYNFEDGIVCSESFAEKMTTVNKKEIVCELFFGDKLIYQLGSPVLKNIDSPVNYNDIIFNVLRSSEEGEYTEELRSKFSGVLEKIEKVSFMHPSVARFRREPFQIYKATISQEKPLRVGDKIMGRHGNKGVISSILPDDEMPKLPDGTPVEVILNPNGVISRMNLSQILETHWGWVAHNRKKSKDTPLIFPPFQDTSEKVLQNRLKKIPDTDATGKVTLTYRINGKTIKRPVVAGLQYILKLNHMAEDKLKIRKTGRYNQLTGGAIKGKGGGQRIGEMEFWALRSFGANATISETFRIKNLTENKKERLPLTSISLDSILKAMCLITDIGADSVSYSLANTEEITSWGSLLESSDIRKHGTMTFLSCKLCQSPVIIAPCSNCNQDIKLSLNKNTLLEGECSCRSRYLVSWKCECGSSSVTKRTYAIWETKEEGLLDPELFGTKNSIKYLKQFGIIELNAPVFNPLYEIKIGSNRDKRIIRGASTYIVTLKGGNEVLKEINLSNLSAFRLNHNEILTPVEALNKQFSGKLNEEIFQDLTITKLPVIPLAFRDPDNHGSDLHKAYYQILEINERLETTKNSFQFKKLSILLQRAVHRLFWGDGTSGNPGLAERIQGRKGLLRTAMLARRVDFSARAVIVPQPSLHLSECILPVTMKTFFNSNEYKSISNSSVKRVLIHRAATLHKYNIISFKVKKFWDKETIGFPPLTCSYMNADFDGDTVAVHLPLSPEAYKETLWMSPEKYLCGYANGSILPHITQDIVLGLYHLAKSARGRRMIANMLDVSQREIKSPFTGSRLKKLCQDFLRRNANNMAANKIFELSLLGFKEATLSGATFSIFDVPAISLKERLAIQSPDTDEWRQNVLDKILILSKTLADGESPNGVAWMIDSGARGGKDQIVQLGGMRGSMYRPNGDRIKVPVAGNFREGLKSYEYWVSASGTRKGMIDKHVNTQPAGILHRKLVESGYPLEIAEQDCRTKSGIYIRRNWNIPEGTFLGKAQKVSFSKRIIGRTLSTSISLNVERKRVKIAEGKEIDYILAKAIDGEQSIQEIKVRSPLLCESRDGICSKCYGLSLDRLEPQQIGTPVGLIAGHIIGERGVQLAMRTFHTGGASVSEVISSLPWIRGFLGAKKVDVPVYKIKTRDQTATINRWDLILSLLNNPVDYIEETKGKETLSINEFLMQLIPQDKEPDEIDYPAIYDHFLHVISFETLSIYSGDVADIHFESIFRSMLTEKGTFRGIFSQAAIQGSVLGSAAHDRALQRIFKAAIENHEDMHIPWREKFIRGLFLKEG